MVAAAVLPDAADLQLGTANADSLNGGAGGDCIIGGAATTPSTGAPGRTSASAGQAPTRSELRHRLPEEDSRREPAAGLSSTASAAARTSHKPTTAATIGRCQPEGLDGRGTGGEGDRGFPARRRRPPHLAKTEE